MLEHGYVQQFGKLKFIHRDNAISSFSIDNINVDKYIIEKTPEIIINYNFHYPYNNQIIILEEYVTFYYDYLEGLLLFQEESQRLAAELATHIYSLMATHWQKMLSQGQHIKTILFFKHILKITLAWEREHNCHIHKGTLYGFIAYIFLIIGDSQSGFSYLNCALADDIRIGEICPELNYPLEAPSNLTISLNVSKNNFMHPFVNNVKNYLHSLMETYTINHPEYKTEDFDRLFLENGKIIHLKIYFVYCIWQCFDSINKYEFYYTDNTFNKQVNLNNIFNLSLVLDNVLQYYQNLKEEKFQKNRVMYSDRIKKFIETSNLDITYFLQMKTELENTDLDISIPELLDSEVETKDIEVNYLLVSLLLRNFVAHKIEPLEISFTHYNKIIKAQIYTLIMIINYYNC